jgi:hypothetical protein
MRSKRETEAFLSYVAATCILQTFSLVSPSPYRFLRQVEGEGCCFLTQKKKKTPPSADFPEQNPSYFVICSRSSAILALAAMAASSSAAVPSGGSVPVAPTDEEEPDCGICLDKVTTRGILDSCDHACAFGHSFLVNNVYADPFSPQFALNAFSAGQRCDPLYQFIFSLRIEALLHSVSRPSQLPLLAISSFFPFGTKN